MVNSILEESENCMDALLCPSVGIRRLRYTRTNSFFEARAKYV